MSFRITLIGTGDPQPRLDRFGPAILVEAAGQTLLFDCGRGAVQHLRRAGHPLGGVTRLFLTHLHSDHVVGIPDLMLTAWLIGRRTQPLQVWGPAGTAEMMSHLRTAYEFDIGIRIEDDRADPAGIAIHAADIEQGLVYACDDLKVTAFDVDHRPVKPALGYRLDYQNRTVVLSGDTRVSENLIRFAEGADLLIHEVALADDVTFEKNDWARRIIAHHTTPAEAGEVFSRIHPKLAVYSHITIVGAAQEADLIRLTRTTYQGPLVLGEDLMVINVGDTVTVSRNSEPRTA
jgi:ribonuclease Z